MVAETKLTTGLIAGLSLYIIGQINVVTLVMFCLMFFDLLTGIMADIQTGKGLSKEKARKGLFEKFGYIILFMISILVQLVIEVGGLQLGIEITIPYIALLITTYIMGVELASIKSSLDEIGVQIPKWFSAIFEKFKKAGDE